MIHYSPIFAFTPYTPALTDTIRLAREAMWRRQLEVPKRALRHKAQDSSAEPSTKKRRTKTIKPTQLPPNLPPDLAQLLAQALKTQGL